LKDANLAYLKSGPWMLKMEAIQGEMAHLMGIHFS